MDRRSFLKGSAVALASASVASGALASGLPNGIRASTSKDDPGYTTWVNAKRDGKEVRAYLNGYYERGAMTADENLGLIVRGVRDDDGYPVIDCSRDEIVMETLYGDVRIVIS